MTTVPEERLPSPKLGRGVGGEGRLPVLHGILDVRDVEEAAALVELDEDDVNPSGWWLISESGKVGGSGVEHTPALGRRDRQRGAAESVAPSRTDLDQRQSAITLGDNIDLTPWAHADVCGSNPVTVAPQARGGDAFAECAEIRIRAHGGRRSRTGAKLRRWIGLGPSTSRASRWALVPYPLCEARS